MSLAQKKAIFFDFDGVIVESNAIKTHAFYELYLPYGKEIAAQAKAYHSENEGINRDEKFDVLHPLFFNKPCSEQEKKRLSAKLSKIILDQAPQTPFVKGIIRFLEKLLNENKLAFLLSAAPHQELLTICKEQKIAKYFKEIYGAPYKKHEAGISIMNTYKLKKHETVFIGDSLTDLHSAQKMDIPFIGRISNPPKNPFPTSVPIIHNFLELSYL